MYIRTRLLDRRLRIHNPNKYFNYKIRNFKVMVINHTVKLNKLYKYITENLWTYMYNCTIVCTFCYCMGNFQILIKMHTI